MARRVGTKAWMPVALGAVFALPVSLPAQELPATEQPVSQELGGTSTMDLIMLKPGRIGNPLRFGSVIPGSERVTLDGRVLTVGQEYSMDYASGVVYLKLSPKPGQSLSVSYRYDPSKTGTAKPTSFTGLAPFKFNLMPGSLGLYMGMGLTERGNDGTVTTSNLYGLNNSFSFAGGSTLKGLYLVGNKEQVDAESQYEYQERKEVEDAGQSSAIVQTLQSQFLGGTVQADYQDISENFTGFAAFRDSGYQESAVEQLTKERGLKRLSFGFQDVTALGLNYSSKTVQDGDSSIDWTTYGINTGGLTLNYSSQEVGKDFKRFKDLGEEDRKQLEKEAGLKRETMDGTWNAGFGTLSFNGKNILDGDDNGISRQEFKLDTSKIKFLYGEQEIDKTFNRFNSLHEPERGQWGREAGMNRMWASIDADVFGEGKGFKFATSAIESEQGEMVSTDASITGKNWSLEHASRKVDDGFTPMGNLPEPEIDGTINAISNMYEKGGVPFRPEERRWMLESAGIDRAFTRFEAQPAAGWQFRLDNLQLEGDEDGASLQTWIVENKDFRASYRKQDLGEKFHELGKLMEFEKKHFGTLNDLDRTDLNVSLNLKGGKLDYSNMEASTGKAGAERETLNYSSKDLELKVNRRVVDADFENVSEMLDPERNVFNTYKGFEQADAEIKWQVLPNLRIEAMGMQARNSFLEQERDASNLFLNYRPLDSTEIQYQKFEQGSAEPGSILFAESMERISLTHNMGRYGTLKLAQKTLDYAGTQNQQPDSVQHLVAYQAKVDQNTSVQTEHIRTNYDDGTKEKYQSHSVETKLNEKVGVNVTDIKIDRDGEKRDEQKTAVGGWLALGGGVRLNIGLSQQLNNAGTDMAQNQFNLTPGQLGNLKVDSASYNERTWEQNERVQAMSNIGFSTAKPFDLGFFEEVTLAMSHETAADKSKWLRENRSFAINGKIGENVIGYQYRSQMDNQEERAVDRVFSLTTTQDKDAWLKGTFFYKLRTLPEGETFAIRNWTFEAKPADNMTIQHQLTTNPEAPRGDVLLGSVPQPGRISKWKLDYNPNTSLKLSGSWDELRNDSNDAVSRLTGITLTLFEGQGSPLSLFYGKEEMGGNVQRRTVDRFSLKYTQRPGPNQAFSLYLGNVTYGYLLLPDERRHNFSAQLEYQLRF